MPQGREAESAVKDAQSTVTAAQQAAVASRERHRRVEDASMAACRLAGEMKASFQRSSHSKSPELHAGRQPGVLLHCT